MDTESQDTNHIAFDESTSGTLEVAQAQAIPPEDLEMLKTMSEAGVHYGRRKSKTSPRMDYAIYTTRNNIAVIDVSKTLECLREAAAFLGSVIEKGGSVLVVGTQPAFRDIVEKFAKQFSFPVVTERWLGGTLTNFTEIRKRVERLKTLRAQKERGDLNVYSKKERRDMEDEMARLTRNFNGVLTLERMPEALFIVDPRHEDIAVREAKKTGIALIALANSDCNMKEIAFPIPGNDGARSSILFFLNQMKAAYQEGVKDKETAALAVAEAKAAAAQEEAKEKLSNSPNS